MEPLTEKQRLVYRGVAKKGQSVKIRQSGSGARGAQAHIVDASANSVALACSQEPQLGDIELILRGCKLYGSVRSCLHTMDEWIALVVVTEVKRLPNPLADWVLTRSRWILDLLRTAGRVLASN